MDSIVTPLRAQQPTLVVYHPPLPAPPARNFACPAPPSIQPSPFPREQAPAPLPKAFAVRGGGMDLGPLNSGLASQLSNTAAAVTVGAAVLDKYGGLSGSTLGKAFSGDLFTTNAVIALASGGLTVFTHSVGGGFDTAKLVAGLWIINFFATLRDSSISADSIMENKEATVIAVALSCMAFID